LTGHTAAALGILADVVRHPTFPADEVDRVRDADIVALGQSRDDADTIAESVGAREVYGTGHPYGHRTEGTEDGLRAATVDDLRRAHERAFTPDTTALVLAGDLSPPQARALAEEAFGSWNGPPAPDCPRSPGSSGSCSPAAPGPPAGSPDRILIVDKPGASQTALYLAAPGVARSDPDYEPLPVTNDVFGGSFSSRLNQNLRERRGYTYGVYSDVGSLRGVGLLTIAMDVQTPATADAVRETIREADTLTASGVTADELRRAEQSLTGSIPSLFATRKKSLGPLRTLHLDGLP